VSAFNIPVFCPTIAENELGESQIMRFVIYVSIFCLNTEPVKTLHTLYIDFSIVLLTVLLFYPMCNSVLLFFVALLCFILARSQL
jgi:hypothetical protein